MTDIDIEKFELAAHRSDIIEDVNNLIENIALFLDGMCPILMKTWQTS